MFRFPRDPDLRKKWAAKVKRVEWFPTDNSALCAEHFESNQFTANQKGDKIVISSTAIPTIFSHCKQPQPRRETIRQKQAFLVQSLQEDHFYTSTSSSAPEAATVKKKRKLDELRWNGCEVEVVTIENELHREVLRVRELQERIKELEGELSKEKERKCPCTKIFGSDQLQFLDRGKLQGRGNAWSEKTITTALKLRFSCGASGYDDLLKVGFPLPSFSTLQKKTEHIAFESGILTEIFHLLAQKSAQFSEEEKWCSLSMDEMSIKKSLDYDLKSDSFMGYVTLPGHSGEASKAFCIQLGGLTTRWKQIVGYYFTGNSVDGSKVGPAIMEVMSKAHEIGLKISSITNDFGSSNLAIWS